MVWVEIPRKIKTQECEGAGINEKSVWNHFRRAQEKRFRWVAGDVSARSAAHAELFAKNKNRFLRTLMAK